MHVHLWSDMFVPGLPIIEKILRALTVYVFLLVALRLAGRRELAQLNAFDLVVLLTISNTVQNAIIGNDNSVTGGLVGAATLLAADYLLVRFSYTREKKRPAQPDAGGVLIENGEIRESALRKELITMSELRAAASRQGFESLAEVEHAVIHPDGTFAFVRKKQPQAPGIEYQEILNRLDRLHDQMQRLQPSPGA
jgi:uncharacterized membrane protein YcaP (DUF421 family)